MRPVFFALLAGIVPAMAGPALAAEPKSVVELFTSQSVSSCARADQLANDIAREGDALVLTLPVQYWDYLGWKDTLASPSNSARQRAYASARGDGKVYTPQMVVNGSEAEIGGDKAAVLDAIKRAEGPGALALPVGLTIADGRIDVAVAAPRRSTDAPRAEVWAFAFERSHEVKIDGGENAGRSAVYSNVVRHMTRLGSWDGQPVRFTIPADEVMSAETDGVAVLVQVGTGGHPGVILGAAQAAAPKLVPTATSQLQRPSE